MNEPSRLSDRQVTEMLRRRSAGPAPDGLASAVLESLASARAGHDLRTTGRSAKGGLVLLAAAILLLIGGALAAGSGVLRKDSPAVLPAVPSRTLPAVPSRTPTTGLVAYTVSHCSASGASPAPSFNLPGCSSTGWLAASDGSDARQLPGTPVGWSADGSRLLVQGNNELMLLDVGGSQLATFPLWCASLASKDSCTGLQHVLCQFPCSMADGYALSPDGTQVAFVRGYANDGNATVIAILDLASGQVTELASTRATNPPNEARCYAITTCQGSDDTPRWSPDGSLLVFARQTMSPDSPQTSWTSGAIFVVDADGSHLRRVTPTGLDAIDPHWSSDGTHLAFTNTEFVVNASRTSVLAMHPDIYTIGLDGTDLTRLTTDGMSGRPSWTADGQLVFMRDIGPIPPGGASTQYEHWIMDANGANQSRAGDSLAELTTAGCRSCFYVADAANGAVPLAYWQPTPGGR